MRSPRLEFSRATKEQAYERAQGKCELCCIPFNNRSPEYHHRVESALGGGNDLGNCQVLCPKCHRIITSTVSARRVAKVKRIEAKCKGWKKKSAFHRFTPRVRQLHEEPDHDT